MTNTHDMFRGIPECPSDKHDFSSFIGGAFRCATCGKLHTHWLAEQGRWQDYDREIKQMNSPHD